MRKFNIAGIIAPMVLVVASCTTGQGVPVVSPTTGVPDVVTTTANPPTTTTTTEPAPTTTKGEPVVAPYTLIPYDDNPVISAPGPKGSNFVPGVIADDDGTLHMWYTSSADMLTVPTAIYHATSEDGLTWVTSDEPALAADADGFDAFATAAARVVADEGTWVMFYNARSAPGAGPGPAIGRAVATDPAGPWTREEEPVLTFGDGWDSGFVTPTTALMRSNEFALFYSGGTSYGNFEATQLGLATADTPLGSLSKEEAPVLAPSGRGWDGHFTWEAAIVANGDSLEAFYTGDPTTLTGEAIGYAESQDGRTWSRWPDPLLKPRAQGWARLDVVAGSVVDLPDGTRLLFYSGGNSLFSLGIGVAEVVPSG